MFRLWAKIFKDNRMLKDTVICDDSDDTRTHKVFHALDEICYQFDLGKPISVSYTHLDVYKRQIHAHGNVCGLFVQRYHNAAGVGVKSVFGLGITDFPYGIAYDFLDIHIGVCGDFAHHQNKARGGTGFTGHTAHGILLHQCVKHRIGDRDVYKRQH